MHTEGWRPQSTALQLQALVQAARAEHAEHLHTGDAQAHGPADPQVLLDEGLQLGDAAAPDSAYIGGVVPPPTASNRGLAAAVGDHMSTCLARADALTVLPGLRAAAATTVELLLQLVHGAAHALLARLVVALGHGVLQVSLELCVQPLNRHRLPR